MKCKYCNNPLGEGDSFCTNCGNKIDTSEENNVDVADSKINNKDGKKKKQLYGTLSQTFGILSIILSTIIVFSLPLSIVGMVLGNKYKKEKKSCRRGYIFSTVGLILTVVIFIIAIIGVTIEENNSQLKLNVDDYQLSYSKDWSETTLSSGDKSLKYKDEESYLAPVGRSKISETEYDFTTPEGKKEVYQDFYTLWNESLEKDNMKIYLGSNDFTLLKDDIYYATYDYGLTSGNIKGKYFLLVSIEKDAIISLMSNSDNYKENDRRALEIIRTIEINTYNTEEDDLSSTLDTLSNWNVYSNKRESATGTKKILDGEWRVLSDLDTYWKFKDGKFWWYKSLNDTNDNYWYGTTKIVKGKKGVKEVGIEESRVDSIIANSNGKVTENDIYTVICKPTKVITGGEDKTSTNMNSDTKFELIWILVDHGNEGIEGQLLNMTTSDTSYYIKYKD